MTPDCVQLVRSLRESQISNGGLSSPSEASTSRFTPAIQIPRSYPDEEKKYVGLKTIKISSDQNAVGSGRSLARVVFGSEKSGKVIRATR